MIKEEEEGLEAEGLEEELVIAPAISVSPERSRLGVAVKPGTPNGFYSGSEHICSVGLIPSIFHF